MHRLVAMATLDIEDDTFTVSRSTSVAIAPQTEAMTQVLEERVRELETKVREREARIAELMYEQGNHAKKIPQLETALGDQRKRNEDFDRERQRQDKWLDVLNDQLARARNQRQAQRRTEGAGGTAAAYRRTRSRGETPRRRDRRPRTTPRRIALECATARTTIAHLQSQLDAKRARAPARNSDGWGQSAR